MITIPNLSFKTKKYLLCIFLIVQILVFMWRQRAYFTFVMSIVHSPFVSLILIYSQFLILVSKHMNTLQKRQGWWSVFWDGKNWWFCDMLICSLVHFFFDVNIYSLLSFLHWCLKYQKKIWPRSDIYLLNSSCWVGPLYAVHLSWRSNKPPFHNLWAQTLILSVTITEITSASPHNKDLISQDLGSQHKFIKGRATLLFILCIISWIRIPKKDGALKQLWPCWNKIRGTSTAS